jgi:uncharacterized protein (DUF697 family)
MADTAMLATAPADSSDVSREMRANDVVNRYAAWAAAAGVIPVPLVDVLAIGGVQLRMLRRLSEVYGVAFSENRIKSYVAALVGSILPASAAAPAAMGVASVLKFVPIVGTTIASLSMPAFSAAATYAVGKVFIQHFGSGGTLLDFNPKDYVEFMKAQNERAKARALSSSAPETRPN